MGAVAVTLCECVAERAGIYAESNDWSQDKADRQAWNMWILAGPWCDACPDYGAVLEQWRRRDER